MNVHPIDRYPVRYLKAKLLDLKAVDLRKAQDNLKYAQAQLDDLQRTIHDMETAIAAVAHYFRTTENEKPPDA